MQNQTRENQHPGSRELAVARDDYRRRLDDAVSRIVGSLSEMPAVRKVILFGSYAEGRRDLLTDLDLVVVMESQQDFVTRTANMHRFLHPGVDMDLLVYTPSEFDQMRTNGFGIAILKKSKVLYEKEPV